MLQEPETGGGGGQRGEGAVQAGHQTGGHHQGPGAEAGQAGQGDSGAGGADQGAAHAGDQWSGRASYVMLSFQDLNAEDIAMLYS